MDNIVQKSDNDKCLYRALTLSNGLKVLLISDPHTEDRKISSSEGIEDNSGDELGSEKTEDDDDAMSCGSEISDDCSEAKSKMAAAALSIGVGSFSDPPELPGLAHFLEHMVFMGSEKYPGENAYDSFISKHGGSDNATTDCENTTYEMEVTPQYLKESLDIFAHCFISPLLKVDSMDKEIDAVHDEFELAMPSDSEKLSMLLGSIAKPGHPMSKFMYGNKKSLKEIPHQEGIDLNSSLRDFYNRYYYADIMTLVVQSTDSLETLEEYVTEIFSLLPSKNVCRPSFESFQEPFKTEKFNKLYKIIPIKKMHEITLTWALPPLVDHYRSKPLQYLSTLIGYEGKGSILSYLKKSAWAVKLAAGNDTEFQMNSSCSLFTVEITLTERGMQHIPEVLLTVFQYINMLRAEGPKKYLFEEHKLIMEQLFKYKSQSDPIENVVPVAINMLRFPPEHYLNGNELYFDYDEQLISDCLNCMTIDNVNIAIVSSHYKDEDAVWEVEPWMQCKYTVEEIPPQWIELWQDTIHPDLHLPDKNSFIAENFRLINHGDAVDEYPVKAYEDEHCCLWYKGDAKFKVPKGYAYFHIRGPMWRSSPESAAMIDMYLAFIDLLLCDDIYPALVAGLECTISSSGEGFTIKISGFNDKLLVMLETLLVCISNCVEDSKILKTVEDYVLMAYHNCCIKPEKLCYSLSQFLQFSTSSHVLQKKEAIKKVTPEGLNAFVKNCFSTSSVEGLIQGNISKEEATTMIKTVTTMLGLGCSSKDKQQYPHCMKLPYGESWCRISSYNKEDCHSVVYNYYQLEPKHISTKCMADLFMEFMSEPCFDILRTKFQLGYFVCSSMCIVQNVLGFEIKVITPSNKFKCHEVDEHIENFLKNLLNDLQNMDVDEYMIQLKALIEKKKLVDQSMEDEVNRNWNKVYYHTYLFDEKTKEIEFLEQLDIDIFKSWMKETFMDSRKKKKLSVQVVGHGEIAVNCPCILDEENDVLKDTAGQITSYRYIPCAILHKSANLITDIDSFKRSLPMYQCLNYELI